MLKNYKFSRFAMYMNIEKFFKEHRRFGKCLFVGEGKRSAIRDMFPSGILKTITDYPDVDVQDMPYGDNMFDYVIADQVLEHVRKPWIGVEEMRRVLKPEGWAILTSCLIMHIHTDMDYWRFTPDGLRVLCENFSNIYQCMGSGSFAFIIACESSKKYVAVNPKSLLAKLAMANDGKYFRCVWIIAQK
jgi:SAM-dependent methyltransferase